MKIKELIKLENIVFVLVIAVILLVFVRGFGTVYPFIAPKVIFFHFITGGFLLLIAYKWLR